MQRWGYKTIHFAMKKEGLLGGAFLDETEIEQELNEFGRSGWELVSILELQDGIIAFFKQPLGVRSSVGHEEVERRDSPVAEGATLRPSAPVRPAAARMRPRSPDPAVEPDLSGSTNESRPTPPSIGAIRIE